MNKEVTKFCQENDAKFGPKCCQIWPKSSVENCCKIRPRKVRLGKIVAKFKCDQYLLWTLRAVCISREKLLQSSAEKLLQRTAEKSSAEKSSAEKSSAEKSSAGNVIMYDREKDWKIWTCDPLKNINRSFNLVGCLGGRLETRRSEASTFSRDASANVDWDHVLHTSVLTSIKGFFHCPSIGTTWMLQPGFHCMQPVIDELAQIRFNIATKSFKNANFHQIFGEQTIGCS